MKILFTEILLHSWNDLLHYLNLTFNFQSLIRRSDTVAPICIFYSLFVRSASELIVEIQYLMLYESNSDTKSDTTYIPTLTQ